MATNGRATTIELGLVVAGPDGAHRDLRVVAKGNVPAKRLFAALASDGRHARAQPHVSWRGVAARGARTRPEQSRAAAGLAAAYATSAARVRGIAYSPFARPSHLALEAALRLASRRHATLARTSREGDKAGYARAATRVEAAEKNVEAGIRRLERLSPP